MPQRRDRGATGWIRPIRWVSWRAVVFWLFIIAVAIATEHDDRACDDYHLRYIVVALFTVAKVSDPL